MESNLATPADTQRHEETLDSSWREPKPKTVRQSLSISDVMWGVFFGNVLTAIVVGTVYAVLKG
jgi:hypothetical protein